MDNLIISCDISLSKNQKKLFNNHLTVLQAFYLELVSFYEKYFKSFNNIPSIMDLNTCMKKYYKYNINYLLTDLIYEFCKLIYSKQCNIHKLKNLSIASINYPVKRCKNTKKMTILTIPCLGNIIFQGIGLGLTSINLTKDQVHYALFEERLNIILKTIKKDEVDPIQYTEVWNNILHFILMYLRTRKELPTEKRVRSEVNELISFMHKRKNLLKISNGVGFIIGQNLLEEIKSLPNGLTKREIYCKLKKVV